MIDPTDHSINLACAAALAAQTWEALICFSDEVEYLWRGEIGVVKLLYGCSRYLLLLGQIINQCFSLSLDVHQQSTRNVLCPIKLIFQTIWTQTGTFLLEMVIILRVYALYNRSPAARWCLLLLFIISGTLELWGSGIFINKASRLSGCSSIKAERISIYLFGAGVALMQISMISATLIRLIARYRSGKSQTRLASMVLNQGLVTFVVISVLVTSVTVFSFFRDLDKQGGDSILSWYIGLVSIVTCRLILHMRKLPVSNAEQDSGDDGSGEEIFDLTILTESPPSPVVSTSVLSIINLR